MVVGTLDIYILVESFWLYFKISALIPYPEKRTHLCLVFMHRRPNLLIRILCLEHYILIPGK